MISYFIRRELQNFLSLVIKKIIPQFELLLLNPAAISVWSLEMTLFWASRITGEYILL